MATTEARRTARGKGRAGRRRVTPDDLTRYVYLGDPQVSPDGATVLFTHKRVGEKNDYVRNLWTVSVEGGAPRQFTSAGKDSQPRWSPDGERIAFISERKEGCPQIYLIDAGGGEAVQLTDLPQGSIGAMKWSPDGRLIAVSFREQDADWTDEAKKTREDKGLSDPPRVLDHWWYRLDGDGYFNGQRYHLYLVDVAKGEARKVYSRDTLGFFTFDFAPDSTQMVIGTNPDRRAGLRAWNDQLVRLRISTGKVTPIPNLPPGPKDSVSWSPDGKTIAYAGHEGPDPMYSTENCHLWVCDPVRGGARCLTRREDYCLMAVAIGDTAEAVFGPVFRWSGDSRRIFMQIGWHGEVQVASVPRAGGPVTMHTSGARVHSLGNVSADGKCMAMTVSTPTRLSEVHLASLDKARFTATALTDLNGPLLSRLALSRPRSHWIRAADGHRVQVWSMLPPGYRKGRKLPAVLEIHGGPHAQYGLGYFHEFQVLASAGYAVFFPNPRGSKGYGRDHCAAIRGAWGSADWTDMQAVIDFMKEQPFVKPSRMGVMGGSYGGYMTNWTIGHCREFAAAVTDRCVSNLVSMMGNGDFIEPPDIYWTGSPWDRPESLWESSPIRLFRNVRTPTLIIHSEGDLRCNIEQAEQVFAALTLRGVPCRFVRYPRTTSHGMSRNGAPDMRLHRLRQILEWWERYLKK